MKILRFASRYHVHPLIAQLPQSFLIDTPLLEVAEILPVYVHKYWVRRLVYIRKQTYIDYAIL